MKGEEIVTLLKKAIPRYTDDYSDIVGISSISFNVTGSDHIVSVTTALPHGYVSGDKVVIDGFAIPYELTELTQSNGIATAKTAVAHNLTKEAYIKQYIDIDGAGDDRYNGVHLLKSVPDANTFTYEVDSEADAIAGGSPRLLETRLDDINGAHEIEVINDTGFTYRNTINTPAVNSFVPVGQGRIHRGIRITNEADLEGVIDANDSGSPSVKGASLGVVMGDVIASIDSSSGTDQRKATRDNLYQKLINTISIFAMHPFQEITAGALHDKMEDVFYMINKSILGYKPKSALIAGKADRIAFVRRGVASITKSLYIHEFVYEAAEDLTEEDSHTGEDAFAIRRLDVKYQDSDKNTIKNDIIDIP